MPDAASAIMTPALRSGRIVSARHWMVRVPLKNVIAWGSGKRSGVTRLIVELTTEDGVKGYGETICLLDFIEPVLAKVVLPLAIGRPVHDIEGLYRHAHGAGYYHHKRALVMALCAAEMAMWDALGKQAGLPLYALWGGRFRESVEIAAYLFVGDLGRLAEEAKAFHARGFRSFKIKIGVDPATDIPLVRTVRAAIGEGVQLRADVNGAWTPGTARRQLEKLRPYDLSYIEQPLELDDLQGHVELRRAQPVPVALDESAYTLSDVGNIVRAGAADVVLLDPHEIGGCFQARKAAGICESVGIPVTLHSGGELGFSQAAYLHLAASTPNMTLAIDNELDYLADDVTQAGFAISDGRMRPPERPGLGVEPDFDKLEEYRVDKITGAYLDPDQPGWYPRKPAY
jgi:L-rhamnonate dehydratase